MVSKLHLTLVASLALMAFEPSTFAQTSTPQYQLREDAARTGTLLIQNGVTQSEIALNRTYDDLTPEDKAKVHHWYEYIAPGDEPPFPLDGLGPIYKAIGRARNLDAAQGELVMAVTVGPDGKARDVQVLKSPGHEMTRFVGTILLLTRYKPALCDRKKCQMQFPLRVTFRQLKH